MKTLLLTCLILAVTTSWAAEEVKEEWWEDDSNFTSPEPEPKPWAIALIKADGEFVDFHKLSEDFKSLNVFIDFNYRTRIDCIRDGIYRMDRSLEMMNHVQRKDNGEIALTYTQYLGFICVETAKGEKGK